MPERPGVYQFLNASDEILYVGKARNLKKRVASYFRAQLDTSKTHALMRRAVKIQITITRSDNEALLLEANLIKEHKPRYNILLRDDKSYPFIFISSEQNFPRLSFHRGAKREKGRYFGPYPNGGAVRETLLLIQRLFKLRSCEDSMFAHRTRPCLQYQIERCTAPCVAYVDQEDYAQQVKDAVLFLEGKNTEILKSLADRMEASSQKLDYELATYYRDQIALLRKIQTQQFVYGKDCNVDVISTVIKSSRAAVSVLFIRQGRLLGNKNFLLTLNWKDENVMGDFIPQYYLDPLRHEALPEKIIIDKKIKDRAWIEAALKESLHKKVSIISRSSEQNREWLAMAQANARHALEQELLQVKNLDFRLDELQQALKKAEPLERIECFDVSHTQGEATVASCVVYGTEGPLKSDYRRYTIENITGGDDYAAMRQALQRRYQKRVEEGAVLPDLIIIDGGRGQLKVATEVLGELQLTEIPLLAVAKGPTRKPGEEELWLQGVKLELPSDSAALHLIQFIRDEAHRFAITAHRQRRAKSRRHSLLETISGVGVQRRRQLLRHFGGLQQLKDASVSDIAQVEGISVSLAEKIYEALR